MSLDPAIIAALIGAAATLLAGFVSLARTNRSDTSVQQTATGNSAPVTQQVLQQVRHYTVENHSHEPQQRESSRSDVSDDPWGEVMMTAIVAVVCVLAAIFWWKYVFLTVTVAVIVALAFVISGWKRWVAFNGGATMLGVLTLITSGATILALLLVPTAVDTVPSMADISAQWPQNGIGGTMSLLGPEGLLVYTVRLGGVAVLLVALFGLMRTALSLTALLREERREDPRPRVIAKHAGRIEALDNRFAYLAGTLLMVAMGVALASPSVNALMLQLMQQNLLA